MLHLCHYLTAYYRYAEMYGTAASDPSPRPEVDQDSAGAGNYHAVRYPWPFGSMKLWGRFCAALTFVLLLRSAAGEVLDEDERFDRMRMDRVMV
eukprot:6202391-Pleurochrysis_carterae.AAC.6